MPLARAVFVVVTGTLLGVAAFLLVGVPDAPARPQAVASPPSTSSPSQPSTTPVVPDPEVTTTPPAPSTSTIPEDPRLVAPASVGRPWGEVEGITMFRGNPTRTWYGTGPLPDTGLEQVWRYPDRPMCSRSRSGGETRTWCGTGWTGQPVVWERPDGVTEVIVGAYDRAVHFIDADTGEALRPPFETGDLIKGSVTLDPDGFPLIYFGSRDNKLRIVALDRDPPAELWSLDADSVRGIWNDDWDGNPAIVDDLLFEGGENGWFFVVELRRSFDADGLVTVEPEIVFQMPAWTDELLRRVGRNVSIENSPALYGDRVYFANSGGRVLGLDVSRVREGVAPIVFDYWVGDDVDATVVVDEEGMLYVAVEEERKNARSREVGQLVKLDPSRPDDPYLWGVPIPGGRDDGGVWATPALGDGFLYVPTQPGELLAVDTVTGEVTWRDRVGWHAWSSPVIVDGALLVATCSGKIRAYGLEDPSRPTFRWESRISESCIESTPAVWEGRVYVGARDGFLYGLAGPGKPSP